MKNTERNLRPKIHLTPETMWMNDPNGMFYENGNYHTFYQHYPKDIVWGPMHWAHAVSRDLINWEHQPIALYPDELGQIFSGSCVYDVDNLSGFGTKENPPVIAMFTSHGETEQQSIAYSTDMVHFEKYYGNPVIANTELQDFRDPKMFYNEKKGGYSVVVAAGDRANFYFTKDFKNWEKTGEFGEGVNKLGGVWECPDMIKIDYKGTEKWVFILSTTAPSTDTYSKSQYFIGDFDGDKFIQTDAIDTPLFLDLCPDNYAGVSFQNSDKPIIQSWGLCWSYANKVPTGGEFRGQMTLAREVGLTETENGIRLVSKPVGLDKYKAQAYSVDKTARVTCDTFGVSIKGKGNCDICLSNDIGEEIKVHITDNKVILDRKKSGRADFYELFATDEFSICETDRPNMNELDIDLVFDVSVLEMFAFDGLLSACATVYPTKPYNKITINGDVEVKLYEI